MSKTFSLKQSSSQRLKVTGRLLCLKKVSRNTAKKIDLDLDLKSRWLRKAPLEKVHPPSSIDLSVQSYFY